MQCDNPNSWQKLKKENCSKLFCCVYVMFHQTLHSPSALNNVLNISPSVVHLSMPSTQICSEWVKHVLVFWSWPKPIKNPLIYPILWKPGLWRYTKMNESCTTLPIQTTPWTKTFWITIKHTAKHSSSQPPTSKMPGMCLLDFTEHILLQNKGQIKTIRDFELIYKTVENKSKTNLSLIRRVEFACYVWMVHDFF